MTDWKATLPIPEHFRDYLGHVTAAAHLALLEHGRTLWLGEVMDDPEPAFAVVRQEIDYRRELLVEDGPVTATLRPVRLSRSTVTVTERLLSTGGSLHTESTAILVRWDRTRRRSRPFLPVESARLEAMLGAAGPPRPSNPGAS